VNVGSDVSASFLRKNYSFCHSTGALDIKR
jgi:hypothetical protein